MADPLDVVPIGVEDVCGVVVRVVLSADSRRAVIGSSCREPHHVEPVDGVAIGTGEGDVRAADRVAASDSEVEPAVVREVVPSGDAKEAPAAAAPPVAAPKVEPEPPSNFGTAGVP